MHVLVLGGYGLIGAIIVRRLLADGHSVTAMGRNKTLGERLIPAARWIACDIAQCRASEDWATALAGVDAVVNASGALQDGQRDHVRHLQQDAMIALIDACAHAGTTSFIQISAVGAEPGAPTQFMATKAVADAHLRASDLNWTILKPGLVIAPAAYGGTALIRAVATLPGMALNLFPKARIQTVSGHDVADAVLRTLDGRAEPKRDYDLVECSAHSITEIVAAHRDWLGLPRARLHISCPDFLVTITAKLADLTGWLGWRSPLRSTAISVLRGGVTGDANAATGVLGRPAQTLAQTLAGQPARAADRMHASLSLLFPLLLATLSVFWTASGVIGFVQIEAATDALSQTVAAPIANLLVASGSILDILLGAALLYRPATRLAAWGMIALTLAYLVSGTALTPHMWADPFGAFVKSAALIFLPVIVLVLRDDR